VSWDELVAAALIGTDRRPVPALLPEGSPPGLEATLAARGAEDRLLGAAAAWTVARRAGAMPGAGIAVGDDRGVAGAAPGVPAAEDARPIAPGARLRALLEGDRPELLPEWLALAAERGLRPPPELVPDLLDHAADVTSLHAAVGAAAGPLGRWLAERAPRWAFVRGAGDDAAAVWAAGERAGRRALLERLRRSDPAAGRELLASTFADEAWEDRAAFVATLAHGLSDEDEPLLEAVLDDRRKPVRDAAAGLLTRLPRSRFADRMAERARPLLRVEGGRLVAELPGEPDAAAKRDGVPAGGRRSERLSELLAATPLSTWTSLGARPADIVALPVEDDLGEAVHRGWAQAAIALDDADWARALWTIRPAGDLLRALPRDEAQRLAAAAPDPLDAALALPGPWRREFSKAMIAAIEKERAQLRRHDVEFAGYRLDPALAPEAEARLRELGGRDIRILCDVLDARAAMLRELS